MSLTTELIGRLRKEADGYMGYRSKRAIRVKHLLREAADTIKVQSAKIHAYAMERSTAYYNGGWIPVGERLPEYEVGTYWVCTNSGYQCQCRWTNVNPIFTNLTTTWHWNIFDIPQYSKVTAWMPLPEPYREEGE